MEPAIPASFASMKPFGRRIRWGCCHWDWGWERPWPSEIGRSRCCGLGFEIKEINLRKRSRDEEEVSKKRMPPKFTQKQKATPEE